MIARRLVGYTVLAVGILVGLPSTGQASAITFSVGGDTSLTSIQGTIDSFRTAIGGANNGNVGSTNGGRREINWDGGGLATPTVTAGALAAFQNNRGAFFTTPGTGFIQGQPADLGNAAYPDIFAPFSPVRLFTPTGSNVTDITFFVPGSGGLLQTTTSAFGAIFSDVDFPNTTKIELFNPSNALLFSGFVTPGLTASRSFSFLGVAFNAGESIARVRITTGTGALGGLEGTGDLVAMDDFIFAEPKAVPEPATLTLFGAGLLLTRAAARRARK